MTSKPGKQCEVHFAGVRLVLDAAGAVFCPESQWLIVSDLHLEKASFLSQFGSPLPRYDTRDTLYKLGALVEQYRPEAVICLGDSFHDRNAVARLEKADADTLAILVGSVPAWHWVLGNHDEALDGTLPGEQHAVLEMGGIVLTHEPQEMALPQMIGHYHPKLQLQLSGQKVSGKAFLHDALLFIMPAFGSYTGGLDVDDAAIASQLTKPHRYLIFRDKIWRV